MVRQAAGQDIREYVGGRIFGSRIDMHCRSILVLVIWFVYKKRPELFMRSRKSTLPYTVGEDTIYGVDFAERIADALARTDYREAVRLLYLQTLKTAQRWKNV